MSRFIVTTLYIHQTAAMQVKAVTVVWFEKHVYIQVLKTKVVVVVEDDFVIKHMTLTFI